VILAKNCENIFKFVKVVYSKMCSFSGHGVYSSRCPCLTLINVKKLSRKKNSKRTAKINVKKLSSFQFITMCKGDMNHHEPKNSKNHFTGMS